MYYNNINPSSQHASLYYIILIKVSLLYYLGIKICVSIFDQSPSI